MGIRVSFVTFIIDLYEFQVLILNLGYGKCGEDCTRHTTTKIVFEEGKVDKLTRKAFFVTDNEYFNEEGEVTGWEVKMRKRKIHDDKPCHFSLAILQWSKVLFLRFMYFLLDHLQPGSFRNAYCDTDSICLGLSKSGPRNSDQTPEEYFRAIFDPIVVPEMRESWERNWKSWFVTTSDVLDQRTPGKLKGKLIFGIWVLL